MNNETTTEKSSKQSHALHKSSTLKALTPRRDPYWGAPLVRGRYVGYRKLDSGGGTWIARYRGADGKQRFKSLGVATPLFGFNEAQAAAIDWFSTQGASAGTLTVEQACRDYVADRLRQKGEAAARDIDMRFRRTVYGSDKTDKIRNHDRHDYPKHSIASVYVTDLKLKTFKEWRDGLGDRRTGKALGARSTNRTMTAFKAALNLCATEHRLSADLVKEWSDVPMMTGGNVRTHRDVYLDLTQRRAFLSKIEDPNFHDLVAAGALTGARVGELTCLTVANFDARTESLTVLRGIRSDVKKRARVMPLNPAAVALFKRCAKGKESTDLLLPMSTGARWHSSSYDHLVKLAVAAAKLPKETVFYSLRHSWITEALQGEMAVLEVAKMTGTSLKMIDEHYGHLVQGQSRARLLKVKFL